MRDDRFAGGEVDEDLDEGHEPISGGYGWGIGVAFGGETGDGESGLGVVEGDPLHHPAQLAERRDWRRG